MTTFITYFWIAIGSALGGMLRHAVGLYVTARTSEIFPWGTMVVNISGSLLIGVFAALTGPGGVYSVNPNLRLFLMVGICGGYTTFSAFSLQTFALLREGAWLRAGANVTLSVMLCIIAVWIGYFAAASLGKARG